MFYYGQYKGIRIYKAYTSISECYMIAQGYNKKEFDTIEAVKKFIDEHLPQ